MDCAAPVPSIASISDRHKERPLQWRDYAEAWLNFPPGRLLDYGCGDGEFLSRLPERGAGCCGIDIDRAKVVEAGLRTAADVRHLQPGEKLPFADGAFDTVVALEVVEHVSDERVFFGELSRVLAPGGRLLLTTPHRGLLTAFDPGNFKFVLPRLHRFVHCTLLRRRAYYEQRFGSARRSEEGMLADFTVDQTPWHRHYRYQQIRALAPAELQTIAWAVYFPAFRFLWSVRLGMTVLTAGRVRRLPRPLRWLNARLSRTQSRSGDQLVILFQKKDALMTGSHAGERGESARQTSRPALAELGTGA